MKSGKRLLESRASIRDSFTRTAPSLAECSRRIFIPSSAVRCVFPSTAVQCCTGSAQGWTYCLDFHVRGWSPGLGDPSKDGVLLYRASNSVLHRIWGGVDTQQLASRPGIVDQQTALSSIVWTWAVARIKEDVASAISLDISSGGDGESVAEMTPSVVVDATECVFHDYTQIETCGF